MRDSLLRVYHRLPAPARSIAASLRGLYLRSWRYGPETEGLVEAALERDSWSETIWMDWQEQRRSALLHRAATRVPYYRDLWAKRRAQGDRASWEYLENWPVLTKEALRENAARFVAQDCDVRRMYREQTSGTTGKPLTLWWSRKAVREWSALFEARIRRWNGVSRKEHWAILGGQPIIPATVRKPPFWVWNVPMRQLYLSANHLSPNTVSAYVDALRESGATHLIAYSSPAAELARAAGDAGLAIPALRVVITNAEPLFSWQSEMIRRGLGCTVRETYGMAEAVAGASACSEGSLHLWPEVGSVEVLDDLEDRAAAAGSAGRLVCTGLLNSDMPLVRYAVGDRAVAMEKHSSPCACGRSLPAIGHIEGRTNDVLLAPDGRRVYWLNPVFYGLPIREAQIVQEAFDTVRVRYVPDSSFDDSAADAIRERLRGRMGAVTLLLESVPEIARGENGKLRSVICRVSVPPVVAAT